MTTTQTRPTVRKISLFLPPPFHPLSSPHQEPEVVDVDGEEVVEDEAGEEEARELKLKLLKSQSRSKKRNRLVRGARLLSLTKKGTRRLPNQIPKQPLLLLKKAKLKNHQLLKWKKRTVHLQRRIPVHHPSDLLSPVHVNLRRPLLMTKSRIRTPNDLLLWRRRRNRNKKILISITIKDSKR
jgi:hypothetical protein